MSFVHLHVHTHYSFLRGLGEPKALAKQAKKLEMPGVAITDTGNLHGAFELFKACKDQGIKAIIGVEAHISKKGVTNRDKDNELYSIILLAKNYDGYMNLISLVTESYLSGTVNGKARIDFDLLEKYHKDLIALSGDHLGEISQHITTGKPEAYIVERIEYYRNLFGADSYYLELQEHQHRGNQGKINDALVSYSKRYGFELVATNDVHYLTEDDREAQDLLSCIGDGRPLEDPDRMTLIEGNYSLRPANEMQEIFAYAPQAISNTMKIFDMIHVDIPYGKTLIPTFTLNPEDQEVYEVYAEVTKTRPEVKLLDPEEWNLRRLCIEGLNFRYEFGIDQTIINEFIHKKALPRPDKKLSDMSLDELLQLSKSYSTDEKIAMLQAMTEEKQKIVERLEYELTVVDLMGFNGYFNIVSDFINYGKKTGVPVGPGRGSAAGAILAYLSGITDVDPLKYQLLFERFLNPSRVSMPDIDVDFSDEDRDKVLEYVRNKYGSDHVAQICTFGTMAARAAVKDTGKALGIPFQEMNALAKLMPARPGISIVECLEESTEFKQAYEDDSRYKKVVDSAIRLEGTVRQLGVHACAVIIAPAPMTNYCPLQHPPKDEHAIVTQFSAKPLEDIGLLKMDFLGLKNLTIIERCLKIIKRNHGIDIDMLKIDYDDKNVLKVFAEGDTTGVFQFESAGMRKYLQELKPNKFEDIIAMVALYRPGPMAFIPIYIRRKFGLEKVSYMMEELEGILTKKYGKAIIADEEAKLVRDLGPFLDVTYGIAIYQEQLMQLAQSMGWFSLGEADLLRRWVGKKIREVVEKIKIDFVKKAEETNGYKPETSTYIYEKMVMPAADYSFNKSHAACYAMIAYQTAYLKAYYITEFMTALMISDEEDTERITLEIGECKMKGIEVLPPDVNESMKHFTYIDRKNIRFGLKAVKGLGDNPIESIIRGRESGGSYREILDFIQETTGEVINKKALEVLVLSGAMDRFGDRAGLTASIPKMIAFFKENEKKSQTSQMGLFDQMADSYADHRFSLETAEPMTFEQKIRGEQEVIGYSVSWHGLDGLKRYIQKRTQGYEHVIAFKKAVAEKDAASELAYMEGTGVEGEMLPVENPGDADGGNDQSGDGWSSYGRTSSDIPPSDTVPAQSAGPGKPDEKKKKEKEIRVRFIGLMTEVRKAQTKTGKMMVIANCDSFDFKFSFLVFPKDYDKYANMVEAGKIVLVEGPLKMNLDNSELTVSINNLRTTTITTVRQQAQEMGLFNSKDKVNFFQDAAGPSEEELERIKKEEAENGGDSRVESNPGPRHDEGARSEAATANLGSGRVTIQVPRWSTREDLLAYKEFLLGEEPGDIRIFLDIQGKEVDTKIALADSWNAQRWWKDR